MNAKHTPGPWSIGEHQKIISTGWSIRIPSDGSAIAYVLGERNPELQANARLIAAAPDLLAALKELLHMPEFDGTPEASLLRRDAKRAARAAIDRAGD